MIFTVMPCFSLFGWTVSKLQCGMPRKRTGCTAIPLIQLFGSAYRGANDIDTPDEQCYFWSEVPTVFFWCACACYPNAKCVSNMLHEYVWYGRWCASIVMFAYNIGITWTGKCVYNKILQVAGGRTRERYMEAATIIDGYGEKSVDL